MKLTQLIKNIGDENILVQFLPQCMTNITTRKRKTNNVVVSFTTDQLTPDDVLRNQGNVGVIMWVPRDRWDAATKNAS